MTELPTFADIAAADLVKALEQRSQPQLDALSFGVVRLDTGGRVIFLSRTEAQQSGLRDRKAVGLEFFTELAPCMGSSSFLSSINHARAAASLDVTFEQIGDFDDAERELQVRMVSSSDGGLWICLQRDLSS
jgi:photoactive yellow protein